MAKTVSITKPYNVFNSQKSGAYCSSPNLRCIDVELLTPFGTQGYRDKRRGHDTQQRVRQEFESVRAIGLAWSLARIRIRIF